MTASLTININNTININKEIEQTQGRLEETEETLNKTLDQVDELEDIIEART